MHIHYTQFEKACITHYYKIQQVISSTNMNDKFVNISNNLEDTKEALQWKQATMVHIVSFLKEQTPQIN